jgi:parvulin-like peptidyl-prolyl isomerase
MHCLTRLSFTRNRHLFVALNALAAACLAAACRSTPAAPPPVTADTYAVVDGKQIMRDEVEQAFRRAGDSSQKLSEEEALIAKLSLLDDLIVEEILHAKARTLKIEVPESEVDTAYAAAKKNMPEEAFQQELTRRNLTATGIRDGLRRQLLTQKLLEREVGSKITVTDQEVTAFFDANRAQFNLPEDAYHLAQIVVTPVRDAQLVNRSGDDATTPEAATAKVAMLMERLKGGTSFSELAMDYSEDPESTPRGGDLGLVPLSALKQAAPALRDAVVNVTPGSARVVNQGGALTIMFVVARESAGQRDLSMPPVRQRITDTLRGRKEQLLRTAYLSAARTDAEIVNYLARRVVESQGKSATAPPQRPLSK